MQLLRVHSANCLAEVVCACSIASPSPAMTCAAFATSSSILHVHLLLPCLPARSWRRPVLYAHTAGALQPEREDALCARSAPGPARYLHGWHFSVSRHCSRGCLAAAWGGQRSYRVRVHSCLPARRCRTRAQVRFAALSHSAPFQS